jgi:phospholipid/cholesterol/gamma-HCH transport system ATP-binding protein
MDKDPIIKVRNLTARYGETTILEHVSFDVFAGEMFVILGGSGCGKSTLLKHLIGLEAPHSGNVVVGGTDIGACPDDEFHQFLIKIGVLFQGSALIGSMTLAENIALPILEYTSLSRGMVEMMVRLKLHMVDLDGYEHYLPSELSGGMKKRAGLARALALNPGILFLDEPSAGLDPVTSSEIDDLIIHINERFGTTMVIVTHELASIFKVGQRAIMLDKDTRGIIAQGRPAEMKSDMGRPPVYRFFNRMSHPANPDKDV